MLAVCFIIIVNINLVTVIEIEAKGTCTVI